MKNKVFVMALAILMAMTLAACSKTPDTSIGDNSTPAGTGQNVVDSDVKSDETDKSATQVEDGDESSKDVDSSAEHNFKSEVHVEEEGDGDDEIEVGATIEEAIRDDSQATTDTKKTETKKDTTTTTTTVSSSSTVVDDDEPESFEGTTIRGGQGSGIITGGAGTEIDESAVPEKREGYFFDPISQTYKPLEGNQKPYGKGPDMPDFYDIVGKD